MIKPFGALGYQDPFEQLSLHTLRALKMNQFARTRLLLLETLDICEKLACPETIPDEPTLSEFFQRWHGVTYGGIVYKEQMDCNLIIAYHLGTSAAREEIPESVLDAFRRPFLKQVDSMKAALS